MAANVPSSFLNIDSCTWNQIWIVFEENVKKITSEETYSYVIQNQAYDFDFSVHFDYDISMPRGYSDKTFSLILNLIKHDPKLIEAIKKKAFEIIERHHGLILDKRIETVVKSTIAG